MRTQFTKIASWVTGAIALVIASLSPHAVQAQLDTEVKPYVIMALDTSGSMLKKTAPCSCTDSGSDCVRECLPDCTTEFETRWDVVTQALLGDFKDDGVTFRRSCTVTPRTDGQIYSYDQGYILPDIQPTVLDSASVPVPVNAQREANGLITLHKDHIQFGIVTMDSQPTMPGQAPSVPDQSMLSSSGPLGQWSYSTSRPFSFPGCLKPPHYMELGIRDGRIPYTTASGPAGGWFYDTPAVKPIYGRMATEGRWVSPGATNFYDEIVGRFGADTGLGCKVDAECTSANTRCNPATNTCQLWYEGTLEGLRPFGPTPTAAMLDDLTDLLTIKEPSLVNDTQLGCRKRVMILVTDGAPNADGRGYPYFCEGSPGSVGLDGDCPYRRPEDYISDLIAKHGALDAVFVIGLEVDPNAPQIDSQGNDAVAALSAMGEAGTTDFFTTSPAMLDLFPELNPSDPNYVGYLPATTDTLKATISRVIDVLPQPISSRSVPTFANVLTSTGRVQAQFNTGYTVAGGKAGVLERVRYVCDAGGTPIPTFEGEEAGTNVDDFDALVDEQAISGNREVFTASPTASPDARLTIASPVIALATDMGGIGDDSTRVACLERPCVDNASSQDVTLVGFADYGVADNAAATAVTDWIVGTCDRTTAFCPAIKDIYGSSPVFVTGKPTAAASDQAHALFVLNLNRPDTVYVNDNGGTIHAITANEWDSNDDGTIATDTPEMAGFEMAAFLPTMLLEDAAKQGSVPVMRVTPVVKDVKVFQKNGTLATGTEYRTVLLTGANSSRSDGYVALDVTNPQLNDEKFLWQFSPLDMGRTTGQPALGQVRLADPDGSDYTRGVAILPGGAAQGSTGNAALSAIHPSARVGSTENGMNADAVAGPPPVPYVDWDLSVDRFANSERRSWPLNDGETGRGVWVVDIGSGRTIRSFGLNDDSANCWAPATPYTLPNGASLADQQHNDPYTCPHSPITGSVALYPGIPGTLAQAAYVADADGILWRLDMSDPEETNWKMEPIFDLFNVANVGDILTPQPVIGAPILSVNETGEVVIMLATGDVDNLTGTPVTNRIVSLTEKLTFDGSRYVPTVRLNWQIDLSDEHVTGPMTLSDGILYFTTFESTATANACGVGYGKICGAHYLTRAKEADPTYAGSDLDPLRVFSDGTGDVLCATAVENQVFGGVAVTRRPTCTDTTDPADIDPYFCNGRPAGVGGCNGGAAPPSGISGGQTEIVAIGSTGGTTAVPKSSISQTTSGSAREDRQISVLSWSGTAY